MKGVDEMEKKPVLKVKEDFYQQNLQVGEIIGTFGGRLKVVDLSYKNEFGSFILCEYMEKPRFEKAVDDWEERIGAAPNWNNSYEIIGSIHIPGYRNMLGGIGFFVKRIETNEVMGMSYQQAWNLIYHEGTRNAKASSSHYQTFGTKLIETIDGLPSLDSYYWKIDAYNKDGNPYAPFTREALVEIEKGMKNAVDSLVRNQEKPLICDSNVEDLVDIKKFLSLKNIVVLTGAGISTNSGIPDYRSSIESVWRKHPTILSQLNQKTFEQNPHMFWEEMYNLIQTTLAPITPFTTHEALLVAIQSIKPNTGHYFLSWLSKELHKEVTIITQNIDGLDKKAGSENVIELHGNIHECLCSTCKRLYPLLQVLKKQDTPTCECGSILRPNIIFFGDKVHRFSDAMDAVVNAELIFVVGTTLQVSPFNQLLNVKNDKTKVILINDSPVEHDLNYDYALYGDISKIVQKLKDLWNRSQ